MSAVIYKGLTWKRRILVTNAKDGSLQDLTGATATFRLKRRSTDADAQVQLSIGSGITIGTDQDGALDLLIDHTATALLDADDYVGAAVVVLPGDTEGHVVVPPYRQLVRDLP